MLAATAALLTGNSARLLVRARTCRSRLAAPRERDGIGGSAHARQRIVGELDTVGEGSGHEQQLLLRLQAVGHHLVQRQHTELDDLAVIRPGLAPILGLIAGLSQLRLQVKDHRLSRDPLGQFVGQKVGWLLGCLFRCEVHQLFRNQQVAHCLPLAGLVYEDESIDAVILLVRITVRRRGRAERLRRIRMAGEELFQFRRLRGIGWARDDGLQQITKVLCRSLPGRTSASWSPCRCPIRRAGGT